MGRAVRVTVVLPVAGAPDDELEAGPPAPVAERRAISRRVVIFWLALPPAVGAAVAPVPAARPAVVA
jgi:hypothetical protein